MAGIFTIAPTNSFSFVKSDTLLPNFDNTQYENWEELGVAKRPYTQKIKNTDIVTIQFKTDYTTIEVYIYDIINNQKHIITPVLKNTYTDFKIYEFTFNRSEISLFKIFINASLTNYQSISLVSEIIETKNDIEGLKIEWYNDDNTIYVDYSTGIVHSARVAGTVKFSDVGGKDELYNNFGKEVLISSENDTLFDIICEGIPYYLVQKLIYASRMQHFFVNDCEYVRKESNVDAISGCQLYNLTLKMSKADVQGINNDNSLLQKTTDTYQIYEGDIAVIDSQACYHFENDNKLYYSLQLSNLPESPAEYDAYIFINGFADAFFSETIIFEEETLKSGIIQLPFNLRNIDSLIIKLGWVG